MWGGRFRPFPVYLLSSLASAQGGSYQNIHWQPEMLERDGAGTSQADCSREWRFILVNHPPVPWLAELMAHKHTWLHKGGETDWWNDSIAPGECNFNKSFPHRTKMKSRQRLVQILKSDIDNINIHDICKSTDDNTPSCAYKNLKKKQEMARNLRLQEQNVCNGAMGQS